MKYILVSACLLGTACRYDGASKPCQEVIDLINKDNDIVLIPVCPEQLGGLATPRVPSERQYDHLNDGKIIYKVITKNGTDVTDQYKKGAKEALRIARLYGCKKAILKEKSPSCGCGKIYDGTFTRTLTNGDGVTAELFLKEGIEVMGEKQCNKIIENINCNRIIGCC